MSIFYSIITLVIALFFSLLGFLGILLGISDNMRLHVVDFILENPLLLSLFGLGCLLIGIMMFIYFFIAVKKRYIKIKSRNHHTYAFNESLVHDYMKNYWKQLFPHSEVLTHVTLKKNKVLITADLPCVPESQQEELLARIDRDLKEIFQHLLGYHQKYVVSINFEKS